MSSLLYSSLPPSSLLLPCPSPPPPSFLLLPPSSHFPPPPPPPPPTSLLPQRPPVDWGVMPPRAASYTFPYVVAWSGSTNQIHVFSLLDQRCVQEIPFPVSCSLDFELCTLTSYLLKLLQNCMHNVYNLSLSLHCYKILALEYFIGCTY